MNTQQKTDLKAIADYLRDKEIEDFVAQLAEGEMKPLDGFDADAWSDSSACLLDMEAGDQGYEAQVRWLAERSTGHIFCALARMERDLLNAPVHPDAGKELFLFSGRIAGWDEDNMATIKAGDVGEASELFEVSLREEEALSGESGGEIIIVDNRWIGTFTESGHLECQAPDLQPSA